MEAYVNTERICDEKYQFHACQSECVFYIRREDCRVQSLRLQKQIYTPTERELSRTEYERLLDAAQKKPRLHLLLQTICATGIRVSELRYFTVEAVQKGEVVVNCKNKNRVILIPGKLRKALTKYCRQNKITSGIHLPHTEWEPTGSQQYLDRDEAPLQSGESGGRESFSS